MDVRAGATIQQAQHKTATNKHDKVRRACRACGTAARAQALRSPRGGGESGGPLQESSIAGCTISQSKAGASRFQTNRGGGAETAPNTSQLVAMPRHLRTSCPQARPFVGAVSVDGWPTAPLSGGVFAAQQARAGCAGGTATTTFAVRGIFTPCDRAQASRSAGVWQQQSFQH